MPALTMPSSPAFKSSRFGLEFNSDTFRNQLTNQMQVVERAGARWRAQYTMPAMSRAQMAQWQAFLAALRGQAGTFMGYDPEGLTPRGVNTHTGVTVSGAGQSGSTLIVAGFTANTAGVLLAGDYIGVGGRMHMLTSPADSDGSGVATLSITPALASSPANGAAVTTSGVTCEMRLLDEGQASWSTNAMGVCSGLTFSAIEAL